MRCAEDKRTLICYAGSASEASIGSKPIGSELAPLISILGAKSQYAIDRPGSLASHLNFLMSAQHVENKRLNVSMNSHSGLEAFL